METNTTVKRRWKISVIEGVGVVTAQPTGIRPSSFALALIGTAKGAK